MSEKRETGSAAMHQALPHLAADIAPFDDAQGRLRQGGIGHACSRTFGSESQIFWKKQKKYHAAAGEADVYRVKRPV
jgi:hypothetical protein